MAMYKSPNWGFSIHAVLIQPTPDHDGKICAYLHSVTKIWQLARMVSLVCQARMKYYIKDTVLGGIT